MAKPFRVNNNVARTLSPVTTLANNLGRRKKREPELKKKKNSKF
jgi:hypothetical protein